MESELITAPPQPDTILQLGTSPGLIEFKFYKGRKYPWYQRLSLFLMGWKYTYRKEGLDE